MANETKEADEPMIQQGQQVNGAIVVDNANGVLDNQFAELEKLDVSNKATSNEVVFGRQGRCGQQDR